MTRDPNELAAAMTDKLDIPALVERINKAHSVVSAICEGRQNWTMSVPAQAHSDPDLVITDGLAAGTEAMTALTTALEIGRAMQREADAKLCDEYEMARGEAMDDQGETAAADLAAAIRSTSSAVDLEGLIEQWARVMWNDTNDRGDWDSAEESQKNIYRSNARALLSTLYAREN